jgi:hypothetical protein
MIMQRKFGPGFFLRRAGSALLWAVAALNLCTTAVQAGSLGRHVEAPMLSHGAQPSAAGSAKDFVAAEQIHPDNEKHFGK